MLLRSVVPPLLAVVGVVVAQSFAELSACGQQCINNMNTATGCVPVTQECLCSNDNFLFGVADCANAACTGDEAGAAFSYAKASCSSVLSTSTTTEPATPSTSDTPTTTATPDTKANSADENTPTTLATSVTPTAPVDAVSVAAAGTSSDSLPTATPTGVAGAATPSASDSDADSSSGSKTTGKSAAATATSSSSSSSSGLSTFPEATTSAGLSSGAKAGIAVGALAAAAGVVGIVLCLSRKRTPPPKGTYDISHPLPGAGRVGDADDEWERFNHPQYSPPVPQTPRDIYSPSSNMSELDKSARPYEEMLPRTMPARMV